jgi:hypothetical protein
MDINQELEQIILFGKSELTEMIKHWTSKLAPVHQE